MKQNLEGIDTVLLDIEGTICPISFVKDTLFSYAIKALPSVLNQKWNDPDFTPYRDAFPPEARSSPEALEAHVKDLTERDVKVAYLKNLQGYLWQSGYESQAYSTPLFEDVLPHLQKWHDSTLKISIYSSGSVFAQKLLFAHIDIPNSLSPDSNSTTKTTVDKTDIVTAWFDTTNAGPKTQSASYDRIIRELATPPESILFLSDNTSEIQAALTAGMRAIVVNRPGNAPLSDEDRDEFDVITDFGEVDLGGVGG